MVRLAKTFETFGIFVIFVQSPKPMRHHTVPYYFFSIDATQFMSNDLRISSEFNSNCYTTVRLTNPFIPNPTKKKPSYIYNSDINYRWIFFMQGLLGYKNFIGHWINSKLTTRLWTPFSFFGHWCLRIWWRGYQKTPEAAPESKSPTLQIVAKNLGLHQVSQTKSK